MHSTDVSRITASKANSTVEAGDGDPWGSKDTRVMGVLETMEAPPNGHAGIRNPN